MAQFLSNGAIRTREGRILYADDLPTVADIRDLMALFMPPSAPGVGFVSGGGGRRGATGPRGPVGPQGPPGPDCTAATVVVGSDPGCDATTIQGGINLLPAEGGTVFVREGVFSITATITLPDKPVRIAGAGRGTTVVDMGSSAIAAFTISSRNSYSFQDFTLRGDFSTTGQIGFSIGATIIEADPITVTRVDVDDSNRIEKIFSVAGGGQPQVLVSQCFMNLSFAGDDLFWDGPGTCRASLVVCNEVGGFRGNPSIYADNCWFAHNTDGAIGTSRFSNCFFFRSLSGAPLTVTGTISGINTVFQGCRFNSAALVARFLDILSSAAGTIVQGCSFASASSEQVRIASPLNVLTGNENMSVTEVGSANANRYSNNSGFSGSTIIGAASVVEGSLLASVAGGTTTGSFVLQFAHANVKGLVGIGTIKNTGGTDLEVREEVTDAFGTVTTVTNTVGAGTDRLLDAQVNLGTGRPPYVSYGVSVRHPVASTTFDLEFTGRGAE